MSQKLSLRINNSYLTGMYLAVNAIADAYLLVDGPRCVFHKVEHLQSKHDLNATLLRPGLSNRLQYTGVNTEIVVTDYEQSLKEIIKNIVRLKDCRFLSVAAIPFTAITGIQYEKIINEIPVPSHKKIVDLVHYFSLNADWLDGYADLLQSLAESINIDKYSKREDDIAIIGNLMHRLEGDCRGNADILKKMIKTLGLNPVSVWLDGGKYSNLERVKNASAIISLPYARQAAKTLAQRTNAKLIETVLPFGLEASCQFILDIARATNRQKKAKKFIKERLQSVVPILGKAVTYFLLNKKIAWAADPYILEQGVPAIKDLGVKTVFLYSIGNKKKHFAGADEVLFEPSQNIVRSCFDSVDASELDLVIGNYDINRIAKDKFRSMEFGYPCYHYHVLGWQPFLGFSGFVNFIQNLSNSIIPS
jgi:nitrogenase molybdenum-iron protein alpha/beta subunit